MARRFILQLVILFAACACASAQQSEIAGNVQDPSGAAVPNAVITVEEAGSTRNATSGPDGHFSISVPPGKYKLSIQAKGFASQSQEINAGWGSDAAHLSFQLRLNSANTTVNVTASSGYVAQDSATGVKTDTPILEIPQSLSVVTRLQMDDQQPQSLNEALRYTPGIVPESEGVSSNFWSGSSLMLRGFVPEVYQDGLEDDSGGNDLLDSYFYQSINILSGPASVLYGQASPGGIVDVETKKPTENSLHEVQLGIGNYGRYEGQFDFSGPIDGNDHFLYRLTAVGFTENTQTWFVNEQRLAIAPSLTWKPDANTSLTFLANYTYNPAIGQYAYVPAVGSVLPNPNGKISSNFYVGDPNFNQTEQKSFQAGYQLVHQFSDGWSIESDLRYTTNRNNANMIWPLSLEADQETLDRYSWIRKATFNSFLIDNRAKKEFHTGPVKHVFIVGLNYQRYFENWLWGENDNIPPINLFAPVYYQNIAAPTSFDTDLNTGNQIGTYLQDQISVHHWRFLLGGREDWVNYRYTNGGPYKQYNNKLTWRAGVVYLFDNGLAPYFSYSTSFQPDVGVMANGAALPPTFGEQYEAGIKYQRPNSRNMITGAVYNLAQHNVGVTDPENPNFEVAIGEIRSRGFEFQDHASLTSSLDLIAAYTYTDSKYAQSTETDTGINGVTSSIQGKYQYGVPPQMASLWANYTFHSGLARGFGFGSGVRYVGFSYGDEANSFKVPAFTLVDATLHYDFGEISHVLRGYRIQVNANNLLDKSYVASCFSSEGCYFGLRRTVYATLKFDW